jgi:hypothetical protein
MRAETSSRSVNLTGEVAYAGTVITERLTDKPVKVGAGVDALLRQNRDLSAPSGDDLGDGHPGIHCIGASNEIGQIDPRCEQSGRSVVQAGQLVKIGDTSLMV